ncbi:N-acetylmuramoyl-L-alanine amidase family protein [Helicobacter cappadocius]|uniref:N-acetylmuramoyl-L-alanine amidase n=1 Tax=Helicobacter cappadocius TaxID=3063998 RepID=A0AA90PU42_9HELI|nr:MULTISPECIES: N-acetylmuramoyl-L-alanine amidase [unclassified Helicobacter]MDO7253109.1 N-acetylmuramoyl-L-alanine amidase [Helicobacter sp. faydin-H75]MDP2538765.1 N-acetylmuramoyl-L-alanine amidase [Helicobacter sp. faydin-H76]
MWRILIAILCFLGFSFASEPKILQIIPFGTSSVRITFDQDISKLVIKEHTLKDFRSFLDMKAILVIPKKVYNFSNKTQISIAQNNSQIVRIVVRTNKDSSYQTRIVQKHLYISVIDKLPEVSKKSLPSHKITPKIQAQVSKTTKTSTSHSSKSTTSNPQSSEAKKHPQKNQTPISTAKRENVSPPSNKTKKYRIVIDPGHGGKDCGAMGITKVCEKNIVLSVAKFLEQELKKRGYITYMTRNKDVYINLKERTDFANAKNADLFVSIHANSVTKNSSNSPQGIETYFLSTARSERARKVAELENKDDVDVMNYFSRFSFLNSLNSHRLIASNKLAIDIQFGILKELRKNYQGVVDGGVREGPFWVLAGALMPSVLIEIGYNSNPIEARRIDDKRYQRFLAKGIADGIEGFFAKNY